MKYINIKRILLFFTFFGLLKNNHLISGEKKLELAKKVFSELDEKSEISEKCLQDLVISFTKVLEKQINKNDIKKNVKPFEYFFHQKLFINKREKVIVLGDIHGNFFALDSLIRSLIFQDIIEEDEDGNLRINESYKIICLGDYADRGVDGPRVWAFLMALKIINPDNFFMLAGNHETKYVNNPDFFNQLLSFCFDDSIIYFFIEKVFKLLPISCFLEFENGSLGLLSHAGFKVRDLKKTLFLDYPIKDFKETENKIAFINGGKLDFYTPFNWSDIYLHESTSKIFEYNKTRFPKNIEEAKRCGIMIIGYEKAADILFNTDKNFSFFLFGHQHWNPKDVNGEESVNGYAFREVLKGDKIITMATIISASIYDSKNKIYNPVYYPTYVIIDQNEKGFPCLKHKVFDEKEESNLYNAIEEVYPGEKDVEEKIRDFFAEIDTKVAKLLI